MKYYELLTTVFSKKDIDYQEINWRIGELINQSMYFSEELKKFHKENKIKYYVFSGLSPIEKDKVYKRGRVYFFRLKSLNKSFIEEIKNNYNKINNDFFHIVSSEINVYQQQFITSLYTLNASISTLDGNKGYWKKEDGLELIKERIKNNLLKKYENYFEEELDLKDEFIEYIEVINKKPIVYKYKDFKVLGNKFIIKVGTSVESQKLAKLANAVGILEKNSSLGGGYVIGK